MGLNMRMKQALARETCKRYQKANKKGKSKILDEFVLTTGYHRKYAFALLNHRREQAMIAFAGKAVKLKAETKKKRKSGGGRKAIYGPTVLSSLKVI